MKVRTILLLCLALGVPGIASAQTYEFVVFGDMPYVTDEGQRAFYLPRYHKLLEALDRTNAEFIVHVGDFTTGPFCGDSTVDLRYREFQAVQKPFIFTFGDNDWTDCARGGFDPLERLEKLRQTFTADDYTLGWKKLRLTRQSADPRFARYRENVRWTMGEEMYVALNLPGSFNNWGRDAQRPSAEYAARNPANLEFLRATFSLAARDNKRGVAIFIQANPGLNSLPFERDSTMTRGFDDFLKEVQRLTVEFGKPVVLFHGDTHYFRIDKPLVNVEGHVIPNFTRVETFGHPNYYWVNVKVDPADPDLFTFRLGHAQ
jgi:hypothetical protein